LGLYNSTYHTVWDTYDDALPYAKHQEHTALVLAVMAYGIGNLDHQLTREGFYLPDGMYADIATPKGRIVATLDYENAPQTVKAFVDMFETPAGAPGGGRGGPGGPGVPATRGARGGQPPVPPPAIGSVDLIDKKCVALGTVVADMKVVGTLAKGDGITRISIIRVGQKATEFGKK
jgi:hypothetical protein